MLVDADDRGVPEGVRIGKPSEDAAEASGLERPATYDEEDQREEPDPVRLIDLISMLAAEYGWPHDYWRANRTPNPIGWLELLAWLRATNRRRSGRGPGEEGNPGRWDDPTSRSNFDSFEEERRRRRGQV